MGTEVGSLGIGHLMDLHKISVSIPIGLHGVDVVRGDDDELLRP